MRWGDYEDLALAVAAGLLAGALWELFVEGPHQPPCGAVGERGLYLPAAALEQADRGRDVTIERPWGPDFVLALEEPARTLEEGA